MKTLEQKHGVPTFKTCKKLSKYWKEETLFCWVLFEKEIINIVYHTNKDVYKNVLVAKFIKAPQIHELLDVLPNTIIYENYFYDLEIRKDCVFYNGLNRDIFEVENNNIAECLAQLHLTLKEKELI